MSYRLTDTDVIVRLADEASIPADPANRDYREFQAWLEEGNEPEPYTPPVIDPLTIPLTRVQFHAMLGILGLTDAVNTAVAAMDEPARSIARARINHSDAYRRDNPLFAQLGAMVGMTDAEIDAAWPQALAIE